ncbi:MAG: DUF2284 domain-containing protein [Clostridiales bacterium]|nr:DUF2284 domain-containing protein [Clostridiales bacterium]
MKFRQEVADACKLNYCGMYGRTWTCPPGVGNYKDLEREIKQYPDFFVFTTKHEIEDSFDIEGMIAAKNAHTELEIRVRRALDGLPYRALGAGGCNHCETCTYPDAPCRSPQEATTSIEACGVNVVELAADLNINYVNGANTVTYFSVILFADL